MDLPALGGWTHACDRLHGPLEGTGTAGFFVASRLNSETSSAIRIVASSGCPWRDSTELCHASVSSRMSWRRRIGRPSALPALWCDRMALNSAPKAFQARGENLYIRNPICEVSPKSALTDYSRQSAILAA